MTVLILGGTAEARELAAALVGHGHDVVSSLAGRVGDPALPPGRVRVGGFGGASGLAGYLRREAIEAVVDATHPFAAQISGHAAAAATLTGIPLVRLQRPGWVDHPDSSHWTWVLDTDAAREAAGAARRPFLTTGRQSLAAFRSWAERDVLARVVDLPTFDLPARWRLLRSRGPYRYCDELALMTEHGSDALLTKDSGGDHTAAKLRAAATLGLPVIVIARPAAAAGVATVTDVAAAAGFVAAQSPPR